jgi:type IV secretory pathway VirJ component
MKKLILIFLLLPLVLSASKGLSDDVISHGPFGNVHIYRNNAPIEGVVLFISGDGGWNTGVVKMARALADMNVMVVGIDIVHYMKSITHTKGKCLYPAGDFENLSMVLQKKLKINTYFKPILIGYSSGATLSYALLAQAPANTFKGAIALGFCPDIETSKPFCSGNGLKYHVLKQDKSIYLDRYEKFTSPFIVLQGAIDEVCNSQATAEFLKGLKNTEMINLPKVGHGFSVQSRWMPQMKEALKKIINATSFGTSAPLAPATGISTAAIAHLPLVFVKGSDDPNKPLALMISGDGGWTDFDNSIAESLAQSGISCIGFDTQKYFWEPKSPDVTAKDITLVLEYYMLHLKKTKLILVGYSFGADVIPFVTTRLPDELKKKIQLTAMCSPDDNTDFEVTLSSMLDIGGEGKYNVLAEVRKIKTGKKLCIFGKDEDAEVLEKSFKLSGADIISLNGGHHYDDNYGLVVSSILKEL